MFLSILDVDGIVEFCHGYHKVNPMSKSEWIDVIEYSAYRNLDTFVHYAWLRGDNRRMDYWLKTAFLWSEHIAANYNNKDIAIKRVIERLNL